MKIQVNGQEVEAHRLIMQKANAKEILDGVKKVEIREFNPTYGKMFIDPKKEAEYLEKTKQPNFEYIDENGVAECDKIYKDTKYLYFTNYSGSWSLIVEIDTINMLWFNDDDMDYLSNDLGCKDLEDAYQEYKNNLNGEEPEDTPAFFAISIKNIISHEGL